MMEAILVAGAIIVIVVEVLRVGKHAAGALFALRRERIRNLYNDAVGMSEAENPLRSMAHLWQMRTVLDKAIDRRTGITFSTYIRIMNRALNKAREV